MDRLLDRTQTEVFTPQPPVALFSGAIQDPQSDLEKHSIFNPPFQGRKSQKSPSQGVQKTPKSEPRITKKRFLRKHGFCNTFLTKTLFSKLQLSIIPLKNRCKKRTGNEPQKNTEFDPSRPKNLSKWAPKIIPKSLKICLRNPTCRSCCSHSPPGRPRADKMAPRMVKWRHQACQIKGSVHPKITISVSKVTAVNENEITTNLQKPTTCFRTSHRRAKTLKTTNNQSTQQGR